MGQLRNVPGIGFVGQPAIVGTVDDVGRMLETYRNRGLTHMSFGLSTYVPDPVKKRRSMELFAKELLPELKKW